jgi:TonB-linked SusC/RagA family outer membrane protein
MPYNLTKQGALLMYLKPILGLLLVLLVSSSVYAADFAPPITIKGQIVNRSTGEAIPSVTVKVKGSNQGTSADVNGYFSIDADENAVLVFSHVGYDPVEMKAEGKNLLNIKLQPSANNLDQVIVVAYGTQSKVSSTAAVSTVTVSEIAKKPIVNMTNSLAGRASGLILTQGSGEPGFDGSKILIRGIGTTGNTNPLLIVDGVPRDFSRLDPATVENISVLKDAAAVAPYGVAGANGVILVTTKKGKSGRPTLNFSGYAGIQNPTKVPLFVSSPEYAQMRNEANANAGQPAAYSPAQIELFKNGSNPDAYSNSQPLSDLILPNRLIAYSNINISGGNDDIKYFASLAYTRQNGMWSSSNLNRYNGSLNITASATKTTKVSLTVNSYVEDQAYPYTAAGSIIYQAQRVPPTVPNYYTNGLWSGYIGKSLVAYAYHSGYQQNENTAIYSQLTIDQKLPIKGLSLKGVVSYDTGPDPLFNQQTSYNRLYASPLKYYALDTTTNPYSYLPTVDGSKQPSFEEKYSQNHTLTLQGMVNYLGVFGKSTITALGVVESRDVKYQTFTAKRVNYNLDIDELNFGSSVPTDISNSGYSNGQKSLGFVYRVGYVYDNRYLFEAAGRYDGSYLFAPGERFGYFPSFSAGWRISEENFFKNNVNWVDNLKLRASWGQSGAYPANTQGQIQTYQYLSQYTAYSNSAVLGTPSSVIGSPTQGVNEALQGNPDITWEKAVKTDIGLEATLWKGALGVELDYFYEKRSNMLVTIGNTLPGEYGIATGLQNGGIMSNHGIEVTLTSSKTFSKDLRLDVTAVFTYAKNTLLKTYETSATYDNPNRRTTGRPLNTQFGYKALGYFSPNDFEADGKTLKAGIPVQTFSGTVQPGDIRYADLAGPNGSPKPDGRIDANDQTVIGNPNTPGIIYGLEPRLTWKNFDLDILFQGSGVSNIQLNDYFVWPFQASGSASQLTYGNTWTPQHTDALYPVLTPTPSNNNTQVSSWWMRNDSYIRLKSFELGYTFSNKVLKNAIQSLRIYAAGQNVFTWLPNVRETIDPENSQNNQTYYQQAVFSFGINATF